jgi:flagellar biosynthesis GTPase FlhF
MLGGKLTRKALVWKSDMEVLRMHRGDFTARKKEMDEKLARAKQDEEIIQWIKKKGDPERLLHEIEEQVTSRGRYKNTANWFSTRPEYKLWWVSLEATEDSSEQKRALWLSGPYGYGKTTIMFVSTSCDDLISDSDIGIRLSGH